MDRQRLADLLVKLGLISRARIEEAVADLRELDTPKRFGAFLVERGDISDSDLARALAHELSVPLALLELPYPSLASVNVIPREVAERFCMVPVYARREENGPATLFVAMDDPTWEEALYSAAVIASMPVRPLVAARGSVLRAIARWYRPPSEFSRQVRTASN